MNPDVKLAWLDRLRNGGIPQGQNRLGYDNGKRCCLGVLCDIAVEAGVIDPPTHVNDAAGYALVYDDESTYLPASVVAWAGLLTNNPDLNNDDWPASLAEANDDGQTFEVIADLIEKYL